MKQSTAAHRLKRRSTDLYQKSLTLQIASDQVVTICGMRGTGKTTLMAALFRAMPRATILDPLDQYDSLQTDAKRCVVPGLGADERDVLETMCVDAWQKGNISLFVEEAELALPEGKPLLPATKTVVLRGRNRGIGLVANTRRIAGLKKDVVALSDHVLIFGLFLPQDVDYVADFVGKEEAAKARTLAAFRFLHYHQGRVRLMAPIAVD